MADVTDMLDPRVLEDAARGLDGLTLAMARFSAETDENEQKLRRAKQHFDYFKEGDFFMKIMRDYDRTIGDMTQRTEFFTKKSMKEIDALERRWKQWGQEINRQMTQARRGLGVAGGAMGVSGPRGAVQGMKGQFSQIMGSLPFGIGGILGLMLYGKKREQEFEAMGMRAVRMFDQMGGVGKEHMSDITGRVKAMHYEFGSTGEELQAVIGQFAQFGIGEEAFAKTGMAAGAFGNDLLGVVTALETAYKLQPGSLAKKFGEVFEAGGVERQALLEDFTALAGIAEKTGVNVERLMSTMTQSASSLRVQRQGVGDLAETYVKLRNSFMESGMFANRQAAGAAAMRGVQAATAGLGGLSEGLMGHLAQRVQPGIGGVEGIVKFQEGMLGKGKEGGFAGEMFDQLKKMADEITGGGTREEQIFALQKIAPSLGFEGARAVIDAQKGDLEGIRDAMKSPQEKMLGAFKRRSSEESAWEKVQRQLMMHMADIGSSMLTILVSGFDTLIKVVSLVGQGEFTQAAGAAAGFASVQETEGRKMLKSLLGLGEAVGSGADFVPGFLKDIQKSDAEKAAAASAKLAATQKQTASMTKAAFEETSDWRGFGELSTGQQAGARGAYMHAYEQAGGLEGGAKARTAARGAMVERLRRMPNVEVKGGFIDEFEIIIKPRPNRGEPPS